MEGKTYASCASRMMQFSLHFWSGYLHQPKKYYTDSLNVYERCHLAPVLNEATVYMRGTTWLPYSTLTLNETIMYMRGVTWLPY